jgi:hypothetical protein
MSIILAVINWVVGSGLKFLQNRADNETERQRINALREQHAMTTQAHVVTTAMQFKWFWIPWLMATVPLAAWFGYGMLDTLFNGALPDTAKIPPGLLQWAEVAWSNLFYSGGGVAAAQIVSNALTRK